MSVCFVVNSWYFWLTSFWVDRPGFGARDALAKLRLETLRLREKNLLTKQVIL